MAVMNSLQRTFNYINTALTVDEACIEKSAHNLVNANTPGYTATYYDYKTILQEARSDISDNGFNKDKLKDYEQYRVVQQTSMDNNTVDEHAEKAELSKINIHYLSVLKILKSKMDSISNIIKE